MMTSDGARMRRYCESATSIAILDRQRKADNKQTQKYSSKVQQIQNHTYPCLVGQFTITYCYLGKKENILWRLVDDQMLCSTLLRMLKMILKLNSSHFKVF